MNVKKELLELLKEQNVTLKCGYIRESRYDITEEKRKKAILKVGYTKNDYDNFLQSIDFDYDDGFGTDELAGVLWFSDGTWATRGEYDGSEWWEYHKQPEIPFILAQSKDKE